MYDIEVKICSKNGWFTPAEARNYYGRYDRSGITWHWWGDGTGANNHDNIVNYIAGGAAAGTKSVNYVLSDNKITLMVNPDNVAWTSQGGNATTISVELQPTLGDEGYKKAGWLAWQLEQRYGHALTFYPHNYWFQTACPGTISLDRIQQEKNKWASGGYNPTPPTPTPPATADLVWEQFSEVKPFVTNKMPTTLWNFNQTSWAGFGDGVKKYNKDERIDVYGQVTNNTIGAVYYLTQYSFTKGVTNGFNKADLDPYVVTPPAPTTPTTPPDPVPVPEPDPTPEADYKANLRDIDDTKMWVIQNTGLIDITTGLPATGKNAKVLYRDEEFVASALTVSNGVEYRITDYSYKKGVFNGLPTSVLTLTAPGEPDVPPVPEQPDTPTTEERLNALERAVKYIIEFLGNLFKNFKI